MVVVVTVGAPGATPVTTTVAESTRPSALFAITEMLYTPAYASKLAGTVSTLVVAVVNVGAEKAHAVSLAVSRHAQVNDSTADALPTG